MQAFRFRILFEDQNEFIRDIEIKDDNSFEDFHNIIQESVNFSGNELASFFICDNEWNKISEITLIDMADKFDDETESDEKNRPVIYVMSESKLQDFIKGGPQRLVYEYDFLHLKTFYIELRETIPVNDKHNYPRCVRSYGKIEHGEKSNSFDSFDDILNMDSNSVKNTGLFEE